MTRFSCADYSWPHLSQAAVLEIIKDLGFTGVDVAAFGDATSVTIDDLRQNAERNGEKMRDDAARRGLEVVDLFITSDITDLARLTPTSRHEGDQEELRRIMTGAFDYSVAAGSPGVTLLPGVVEPGVTQEQAIALAAESLQWMVDQAGERGLALSVEPHIGSLIETPAQTRDLLDACPGLTITFDAGHYAYQGFTVPDMLGLLDRIRHVQARFGGTKSMQSRLEDNTIDYPLLVSELLAIGYTGWFAAEFVWMSKWDCDRVDNVAESARMLEVLRASVDAARGAPT